MKVRRGPDYSDHQCLLVVAIVSMLFFVPGSANAGRFLNITETATFPRGDGEVVQATVFSNHTEGPHSEEVLEFQIGVEYGLLHNFQVGFALPNVATVWANDHKSTEVGGTSLWGLFNLLDPALSDWGLSVAAVYGQSDDDRSGELALLAEKPLGDWIVVYNGIVGRAWARIAEFGSTDAMSHSLGASYQVTRSLFLGVESQLDFLYGPDSAWETAGRCVGPNLALETGPLWIAASAHFGIGPENDAPDQAFHVQVGLPF